MNPGPRNNPKDSHIVIKDTVIDALRGYLNQSRVM